MSREKNLGCWNDYEIIFAYSCQDSFFFQHIDFYSKVFQRF